LKHLILPTILGLALLIYAFCGAPSWLQAFIVVTVLLIPSVIVLGYWARVKHSLKILNMLDDGTVSFSIDEDGLSTSSAMGISCLRWKVFSDIWDTPQSHLLLYTNHQFITLPKNQVSPEFIRELREKIHS
jgi:hypothetical protein